MGWEQGKTFIVQRHLQSKFGAHGKFALILEGANRARDIQAISDRFRRLSSLGEGGQL